RLLPLATRAHGAGLEDGRALRLAPDERAAFDALARAHGCTPFMAWYAVFAALLARYTGQPDFGVGAAMVNRERPGADTALGFFTNTVVLRTDLSGDPSFRELLSRARTTAVDAYRHQALPFDVAVADQPVARSPGDNPLY